jgi:hypothetical protein
MVKWSYLSGALETSVGSFRVHSFYILKEREVGVPREGVVGGCVTWGSDLILNDNLW